MYVVTFYSFQGGVGRTLALVNVATELAQRGRRVLVVDFDLEAPGIPSFEPFAAAAETPGIVDYVAAYRETHVAPNVDPFLHEASIELEGAGRIHVMSAGKQDTGYSGRLASINWQDLYEKEQGFLLFEDLRAQWTQRGFDYVLIDSRTGFTDVGGICTRQLPDAAVLLFVPNQQNIEGLAQQARAIRAEVEPPRGKRIDLHFAPSNVPNLDDEDGILERILERARTLLEYQQPAAILHRYDAMDLLDQTIFVQKRPRSRLAREYRDLTEEIVARNIERREGALAFLQRAHRSILIETLPWDSDKARLDRIRAIHREDGEVLFWSAKVLEAQDDMSTAFTLYERADALGYRSPDLFLELGRLRLEQDKREEGIRALVAALFSPAASTLARYRAISVLRDQPAQRIAAAVQEVSAFEELPVDAREGLADIFLGSYETLSLAETIARGSLAAGPHDPALATTLVLALIGSQRFSEAIVQIGQPEEVLRNGEIGDVFNLAMAQWGQEGTPVRPGFERAIELAHSSQRQGANFHQCLALAYAVLGLHESAKREIGRSRDELLEGAPVFSAWRYLNVEPRAFLEDLLALEVQLGRGDLRPAVFAPRGPTEQPKLPLI